MYPDVSPGHAVKVTQQKYIYKTYGNKIDGVQRQPWSPFSFIAQNFGLNLNVRILALRYWFCDPVNKTCGTQLFKNLSSLYHCLWEWRPLTVKGEICTYVFSCIDFAYTIAGYWYASLWSISQSPHQGKNSSIWFWSSNSEILSLSLCGVTQCIFMFVRCLWSCQKLKIWYAMLARY